MPDGAVMPAPETRVRLFGKLPSHGDFVSRGMPVAERDALDAWLADQIDGQAVLGDAFGALYDTAPPWRFAIPDAGNGPIAITAGALAPSKDAAGRRYPITLALAGLAPAEAMSAAGACEELLYAALSGRWDADQLADAAARIAVMAGEPVTGGARWWTTDEDGAVTELPGARPDGLFAALLHLREEES